MATLGQQIKNLEKLNEKAIVSQLFKAVKEAENKFIEFNKAQLGSGENIYGGIVGLYAESTQGYADRDGISNKKPVGEPYYFDWFGDFYKGFNLSISGEEATISSTGVGSGDKKEFLTTNNLFGLNNENLTKVIKDEIIPFINRFARATLKI